MKVGFRLVESPIKLHGLRFEERTRCAAERNRDRPMQVVRVDEDGDNHAVRPCGAGERFDFAFARVESVFAAVFSFEEKAGEIAEAIVEDGHDFTGESEAVVVRTEGIAGMRARTGTWIRTRLGAVFWRNAVRVGKNRDGTAAETVDAAAEVGDVTNEDGIPAI